MHPILFYIGPVAIYTYGVFIFLGVFFGYHVVQAEAKRVGFNSDVISDIIFWVTVISFLGARIVYLIIEYKNFFASPLALIFSRSGFVFYGGVIFGFPTLYFLSKKYNIKFFSLLDVFTLGLIIGHAIGRLGCFFYGCCYGRPTNSFIGVLFPPGSPAGIFATKVIPVQLIESFFLFNLFFLLYFIFRKNSFSGKIFISYLFIYGIFRFIIEFFRDDPRGAIFIFSSSQFISILLVICAIFLHHKLSNKK